jgi:hypothetical protein
MKKLTYLSIATIFAMCCAFASIATAASSEASLAELQAIVIATLDIDDYPLTDAANQLAELAKKYDPQGKGFQISVDPRIPADTNEESEDRKNITLLEAIREICKQDGIDFEVLDDAVVFIPAKK